MAKSNSSDYYPGFIQKQVLIVALKQSSFVISKFVISITINHAEQHTIRFLTRSL